MFLYRYNYTPGHINQLTLVFLYRYKYTPGHLSGAIWLNVDFTGVVLAFQDAAHPDVFIQVQIHPRTRQLTLMFVEVGMRSGPRRLFLPCALMTPDSKNCLR